MFSLSRRFVQTLAIAGIALSMNACLWCIVSPSSCKTPVSISSAVVGTPAVSVSANPARLDLFQGGSIEATISVSMSGGPTGATLSLGGNLPTGVIASFSTPSVNAGSTATLTLTASGTASLGLLTFDVVATATGPGAGTVGRTNVTASVLQPFTLRQPNLQSMTVGTTGQASVTIQRATGFTGPVTFSILPAGFPPGATVSFSPPATTGSSTTASLVIPSGASLGRWISRIVGTSGTSVDTVAWVYDLVAAPLPPDITIAATPSAATVVPGASTTFDLAMTRSDSTIGTIALAVSGLPSGASGAFTPATVSGATSQLLVATAPNTPDGAYPLTVTATAGGIVRSTTVTLTVLTPPDFTLAVTPAALTVARSASGQATVAIQRTGAPGAVAIDVLSLPAGVTATPTPASVTGGASVITLAVGAAVTPGTYALSVRGVAGSLARTAPLTLTVPAPPPPPTGSVTIQLLTTVAYVAPGGTQLIPVRLTRTGTAIGQLLELRTAGIPPGGNAWISPVLTTADTATLQIIGGTVGMSTVTVSAVYGVQPPTAAVTVNVLPSTTPDFSLNPLPKELNVTQGYFTRMSLEIIRSNGFTGPVTLSAINDNPGNYAINFSSTTTTANSVLVDIYASPNITPGVHLLRFRGTSGSVTREAVMSLRIQ